MVNSLARCDLAQVMEILLSIIYEATFIISSLSLFAANGVQMSDVAENHDITFQEQTAARCLAIN